MDKNYKVVTKKKRGTFRPSTSLADFAEMEDLNLFALIAAVNANGGIHSRFMRAGVPYYHTHEIRTWLSNNKVASNANV